MQEISVNLPTKRMSYRALMESYANHLLDLLINDGVIDEGAQFNVSYYTTTLKRGVKVAPLDWKALEPCLFNLEYHVETPKEVKINTPTLPSTVRITPEQANRALECLLK